MIILTIITSLFFAPKKLETCVYKPNKSNITSWTIINDVVMGGISTSAVSLVDSSLLFAGSVRTKYNGGFASIRNSNIDINLKKCNQIKLLLKGDGKKYQFRIKDNIANYYSYIQEFETSGKWEEITLNLSNFKPSFRGQFLKIENFNKEYIKEISFLIANKKEESFSLLVKNISTL